MNFNEAFMLAWEDARKRRGLNKGEFMKQSGINRQRMREFLGGTREVSAYYFAKVLERMRMTPEQFERAFNYSFSEEQKREMGVSLEEEIKSLIIQGLGCREIAKILHCGNEKIIKVRTQMGIRRSLRLPERAEVYRLWEKGRPVEEIAKRFSCQPKVVLRLVQPVSSDAKSRSSRKRWKAYMKKYPGYFTEVTGWEFNEKSLDLALEQMVDDGLLQ